MLSVGWCNLNRTTGNGQSEYKQPGQKTIRNHRIFFTLTNSLLQYEGVNKIHYILAIGTLVHLRKSESYV